MTPIESATSKLQAEMDYVGGAYETFTISLTETELRALLAAGELLVSLVRAVEVGATVEIQQ